ncbi:DUF1206 domain-containing protein [Actinophytocola sp.]|uniref:DUF1206 domain-containing protein n=1 Tax=Actinophytocola sp. TaxID=1872138 RepID=UPI0039C89757
MGQAGRHRHRHRHRPGRRRRGVRRPARSGPASPRSSTSARSPRGCGRVLSGWAGSATPRSAPCTESPGYWSSVAAAKSQPAKARGLDVALKTLAAQPFGVVLLLLIGAGPAAFAVFALSDARYRRARVPACARDSRLTRADSRRRGNDLLRTGLGRS